MKYSFRCKNCGHLEGGDAAAESTHPHACRVCGRGIIFAMTPEDALKHEHAQSHKEALAKIAPNHLTDENNYPIGGRVCKLPFGVKFVMYENWETLWDAKPERLKELGLTLEEIKEHVPWEKKGNNPTPKSTSVEATENLAATDKAG